MRLGNSLFDARKKSGLTQEGVAKRYLILASYQSEVNVAFYARRIAEMLDELKEEHGYSELNAMLALKDILYQTWKARKAAGEE